MIAQNIVVVEQFVLVRVQSCNQATCDHEQNRAIALVLVRAKAKGTRSQSTLTKEKIEGSI